MSHEVMNTDKDESAVDLNSTCSPGSIMYDFKFSIVVGSPPSMLHYPGPLMTMATDTELKDREKLA